MKSTSLIRNKISNTPLLGYVARLTWTTITLPKQIDRLRQEDSKHSSALEQQFNAFKHDLKSFEIKIDDSLKYQLNMDEQLGDIKHRLLSINIASKPTTSQGAKNDTDLFADNHDLDEFYVKFENKFRGTEDEIKERLKIYIPYFKKLDANFKKKPVLDIGCGRGELLDLLSENNIRAIGLDINETMVNRCKERGFEAIQADALDYLMRQKAGSVSAITGFHIVEHIPFSFLLRLFEECHRVLAPGGIIIFETPNPENIHVGSFSFYFDPSHLHPLPSDVLAFAIENRGFEKADILRLHPSGTGHENDGREDSAVSEIVRRFYMEQDYAVIGHKAG